MVVRRPAGTTDMTPPNCDDIRRRRVPKLPQVQSFHHARTIPDAYRYYIDPVNNFFHTWQRDMRPAPGKRDLHRNMPSNLSHPGGNSPFIVSDAVPSQPLVFRAKPKFNRTHYSIQ